jgi:hypothetical protein
MEFPPVKRRAGAIAALAAVLLTSCSTPLHNWDVQTTSTPRSPSLDVAVLASEPVATLGLVAPAALQGFGPALSHALTRALSETSPRIHGIPAYETFNRLNERGLAMAYGDMASAFVRSGILDREQLQRIAPALGTRYVLQPGLAAFDEVVGDKVEAFGFKLLKTRLTTLRLWLQLWDTQTGQMLWESSGEVTVAAQLLTQESAAVSLEDIAGKLWSGMIQEDLLGGRTRSRFLFSN